MSIHVTVYRAEGCTKCANTCTALWLADIDFDRADVDDAGLVDELRAAGVRELPLAVTDDGGRWTDPRVDKIVERWGKLGPLRLGEVEGEGDGSQGLQTG